MRGLLFAFLLASTPALGFDGESPLTFRGASPSVRMKVPAGARSGQPLWESGASDPVAADFEGVLFQGFAGDARVSYEAALRTADGWSPWTPATVERFPNGRFWARIPLNGRKGTVLRFRMVQRGAPAGKVVELYSLEVAAPEREQTSRRPPVPFVEAPSTDTAKPHVVAREEWGAEAPLAAYEPMIPMRLTIHHTEAAQPITPEDAVQEMKVIQRFHQKGRGWIDIGYHFLIDGGGRVYQGRPETVIGAHVRNKNEGNVGISMMGSFHPPKNNEPTPAQWDSLVAIARWAVDAYGIDPATLKGHRDHQATSCPGDGFYPKLDELRRLLGVPPASVFIRRPDPSRLAIRLPAPASFDDHSVSVFFDGSASR